MSFASPLTTGSRTYHDGSCRTWLQRPFAIAALSIGLLASSLALAAMSATTDDAQPRLANGVHVFGESATAGQPGTTYMVMQVEAGAVVGGFYQPASSFDCFYGEIENSEVALTVVDSYAKTEHPFALALENQATVASSVATTNEWVPAGFLRLAELSETDRQVLQTCSR